MLPVVVRLVCRKTVPCMKWCYCSCTGRIFPLSFQGKPVFVRTFLPVELPDKVLDIVPGNILHRAVIAAVFEIGWIAPHDLLPLPLGHRGGLHVKGFADCYFVPVFIIPAARFTGRRPHHVGPRRDEDKLRSYGVTGEYPSICCQV